MSVTRKIISWLNIAFKKSSRPSSAVGKQEQDKQPRDKGPVIHDGVRPVSRLASRTITLRELESVRTGPDQESREEEKREREKKRELLFSSLHLSSSFSLALMRLISRTG